MIDSRILIGLLAVLIAVSGAVFIAIDDADRREDQHDREDDDHTP